MRDVTLVILNSLRIKCHIRRPLMMFLHKNKRRAPALKINLQLLPHHDD